MNKSSEEIQTLKSALLDVLKAIVTPDNGVEDTIWVNESPIGDFIMSALDEEIDIDELQKSPYRCTKTGDLFFDQTKYVLVPRELTAENGMKTKLSGEFFEHTEVDGQDIKVTISWSTIKDIHKTICDLWRIDNVDESPKSNKQKLIEMLTDTSNGFELVDVKFSLPYKALSAMICVCLFLTSCAAPSPYGPWARDYRLSAAETLLTQNIVEGANDEEF